MTSMFRGKKFIGNERLGRKNEGIVKIENSFVEIDDEMLSSELRYISDGKA